MKKNVAITIFSASCLLAFHAFAAGLDAVSVIADVQSADKSCTQGAQKLPIDGVKIGTASDRNQIQADNGWKRDGMKGKSYLILSTKHKGKLIPAASYGPLAPNVTAEQLNVLLKNKICMVDES